jgi:uncharacterized SAM-binding protein YcdF (DUF218 family)
MDFPYRIKILSALFFLLVLIWILGFFIFFLKAPYNLPSDKTTETDAIIVLTGGSMRLEEGFLVFNNLHAKSILISGVGDGVVKKDLLQISKQIGLEDKIDPNKIIIGNIAFDTVSNAIETKIFMELHEYKSLRLVTSSYHMLRSSYIFRHIMPNIEIIENPVISERFHKISYLKFKVSFIEYNKLIGTFYLFFLGILY